MPSRALCRFISISRFEIPDNTSSYRPRPGYCTQLPFEGVCKRYAGGEIVNAQPSANRPLIGPDVIEAIRRRRAHRTILYIVGGAVRTPISIFTCTISISPRLTTGAPSRGASRPIWRRVLFPGSHAALGGPLSRLIENAYHRCSHSGPDLTPTCAEEFTINAMAVPSPVTSRSDRSPRRPDDLDSDCSAVQRGIDSERSCSRAARGRTSATTASHRAATLSHIKQYGAHLIASRSNDPDESSDLDTPKPAAAIALLLTWSCSITSSPKSPHARVVQDHPRSTSCSNTQHTSEHLSTVGLSSGPTTTTHCPATAVCQLYNRSALLSRLENILRMNGPNGRSIAPCSYSPACSTTRASTDALGE